MSFIKMHHCFFSFICLCLLALTSACGSVTTVANPSTSLTPSTNSVPATTTASSMVVSVGQVASHQATAEFQEKPEADRALCGSAHIKAGQDLMGKIGERLKQNPRRKLNGQQQTL